MSDHDWEQFAVKEPCYYIWTDYRGNDQEFWESGRKKVEEIFLESRDMLPSRRTAIEIGCGIGRLLFPMCCYFEQCLGVDISHSMLRGLHGYAERFGYSDRIKSFLATDPWHLCKSDFVYSYLVFQHIEDFGIIAEYIRRISNSIGDDGLAYLQFDTRYPNLLYKVKSRLPDCFLPRQWRTGIRRIRRTREQLLHLFEDSGLSVIKEKGSGSAEHVFLLRHKAIL